MAKTVISTEIRMSFGMLKLKKVGTGSYSKKNISFLDLNAVNQYHPG